MSDMAAVLDAADAKWCTDVGVSSTTEWAEYIAAALTAAGFGPVQAARAEVQDDAWKRGYDACREGQQRHSPYRTGASL